MDNSIQLHEVFAGSGYLSQSAPILFFASNENELRVKRIEIRWPDGTIKNIVDGKERTNNNLSLLMKNR